jgi:hypothetical protein
MEHDVLGDPEEFEAMMAQAQAEARAESELEAEASAGEMPQQEQEQEDLSHVPDEILEEMGKLPEEGAAALLDAYKQRVALRRELESQVRVCGCVSVCLYTGPLSAQCFHCSTQGKWEGCCLTHYARTSHQRLVVKRVVRFAQQISRNSLFGHCAALLHSLRTAVMTAGRRGFRWG